MARRSPPYWRPVVQAGVVVGLAIMGDSLLYTLLPLEAATLGLTLPWVGVLLSANRLVRLVANTAVAAVFARRGPHRPFFVATVLALVTTALYGVAPGASVFLLARLGWGVAWSALRQGGYQTVWAAPPYRRGRMMGVFWGLIRLGSALSALGGGWLRDRWGYRPAVAAVTLATALALWPAWRFPWPSTAARPEPPSQPWRQRLSALGRRPRARWVLLAGLAHAHLEATLVATAGLFLARKGTPALIAHVGTATGFLLAVRWLSDLVFGPLFGALADRFGVTRVAAGLVAGLGVLLIGPVRGAAAWPLVGLALVFVGSAGLIVTLSAAANEEALHTPAPHLLIGLYTTAIDAGLALGPLLAYTLGTLLPLTDLYVLGWAALAVTVGGYVSRRAAPGGSSRPD